MELSSENITPYQSPELKSSILLRTQSASLELSNSTMNDYEDNKN